MTESSLRIVTTITIALVTYCLCFSYHAHALEQSRTFDPFIKDKLITITPLTGESVAPYLNMLKDGERVQYSDEEKYNENQYGGMAFPVVTDSLEVGKIGPNEALNIDTKMFMRPIVIIGDDNISRNWLTKFADTLTQRKAQIFVVNIASVERFKSLKAIAPELYMHATNGDQFSRQFKLKHYPFYADSNGVLR